VANNIAHFAVQADDVERARVFYETCFGWHFEAWGPPGFYRIHTGDAANPGVEGALYARARPREATTTMIGFRCTIGVSDIDAAHAAVVAHGARITAEKSTIPGVGTLFEFEDPEGNIVCAMQYVDGRS
jgi:hypothetical protein